MQITDHQKNKEYSNLNDICEELNALHEENEQLKEDNETLVCALTAYFESKIKRL